MKKLVTLLTFISVLGTGFVFAQQAESTQTQESEEGEEQRKVDDSAISDSPNQSIGSDAAKAAAAALVNDKSLISFGGDHTFSFGLKYAGKGLKVQGVGLAIGFEQEVTNFLSIKASFNPTLTYAIGTNVGVFQMDLKVDAYLNPFFNGMDKLYLGASGGANFFNYFGSGVTDGHTQDIVYTIAPIVGWRQDIGGFLQFDIYGGWRFNMNTLSDLPEYAELTTSAGPEYGFKFKFKVGSFIKWCAKKAVNKAVDKITDKLSGKSSTTTKTKTSTKTSTKTNTTTKKAGLFGITIE